MEGLGREPEHYSLKRVRISLGGNGRIQEVSGLIGLFKCEVINIDLIKVRFVLDASKFVITELIIIMRMD